MVTILAGCGATVILDQLRRYSKRKGWIKDDWPDLWWIYIMAAFLCFASFQAWLDEHTSAIGQFARVMELSNITPVYVEGSMTQSYFSSSGRRDYFVPRMPIVIGVIWTRTGQGIALNAYGSARVYIEPDDSFKTQKRITEDFQIFWRKLLDERERQHLEGRTLGYSHDSSSMLISTQYGPTLTDPLRSKIWFGTKVVFVVSASTYSSEDNRKYESHFCNYIQPLGQNDPESKGKPMPANYNVPVSIAGCNIYNAPIRIK